MSSTVPQAHFQTPKMSDLPSDQEPGYRIPCIVRDAPWVCAFYGLPSRPRCLYYTGPKWPEYPEYGGGWPLPRELRPAHGHAIAKDWDEIGVSICKWLDKSGINWTSVDPVAVANPPGEAAHGLSHHPWCDFLICIAVTPVSLSVIDATEAALEVQKLVHDRGYAVEVALRDSAFQRSAGHTTQLLLYDDDICLDTDLNDFQKPFSAALGLSLHPKNNPTRLGTGGLFLKDTQSGATFLLTAAHVAAEPGGRSHDSSVSNSIIAPADPICQRALKKAQSNYDKFMYGVRRITNPFKFTRRSLGHGDFKVSRRDFMSRIASYGDRAKNYRKVLADVSQMSDSLGRFGTEIGTVTVTIQDNPDHEPRSSEGNPQPCKANRSIADSKPEFIEDWTLIKVTDEVADLASTMSNHIYFGNIGFFHDLYSRTQGTGAINFDSHALQRVVGFVNEDEFKNQPHRDDDGNARLYVYKNGAGSDLTTGVVNGISHFVRENGKTYRMLGVLPTPGSVHQPFSKRGDSGASVVDREGRLVGIIVGSSIHEWSQDERSKKNYPDDSFDITYVTPWWWLRSKIDAVLPNLTFEWPVEEPMFWAWNARRRSRS